MSRNRSSSRFDGSSRLYGIGRKVQNFKLYDHLCPVSPPQVSEAQVAALDALESSSCPDVSLLVSSFSSSASFSLLHAAVLRQQCGAIRALLAAGAEVNARDPSTRWTALHWACAFGQGDAPRSQETLELLLRAPGVLLEAADDERGLTPLMLAADKLNESAVQLLLQAGANPNATDKSNTTPILIAAYHCSYRIADLLIGAGAKLDVEGDDGMSPLMIAVQEDNMDMIVYLVKMGARVDFATKLGTASNLAVSVVVKQFLQDSNYFQTHQKEKKQQMYTRMIETSRSNALRRSHSSATLPEAVPGGGGGVGGAVAAASSAAAAAAAAAATTTSSASVSDSEPSSSKVDQRKVFTSENFPLDLDFFSHPLLGNSQIGMSMCPGRNKPKPRHIWKRDLNTDLRVIKDAGVEILVVLVRSIELLSMGIMELFVRAEQLGLKTLHFPVQDKWVPESMSEVVELVEKLVGMVKDGKKISIFCNGGKGRTGMVVVATMVALGMSVDDAIVEIRRRRHGMIRNPAQIIYLRWFGEIIWI